MKAEPFVVFVLAALTIQESRAALSPTFSVAKEDGVNLTALAPSRPSFIQVILNYLYDIYRGDNR